MEKEIIHCKKAPQPIGAYSLVVKRGDTLYSSGQIALDSTGTELVASDVRGQSRKIMENIALILADCQSSFDKIMKVTIYLRDMADFKEVNEVYSSYFQGDYPARSTVEVSGLPKNALVEIDFIAYCS